jgi:hypothetical protein
MERESEKGQRVIKLEFFYHSLALINFQFARGAEKAHTIFSRIHFLLNCFRRAILPRPVSSLTFSFSFALTAMGEFCA